MRLEKVLWRAGFVEVGPSDGPTAIQMAAPRALGLSMSDAVVLATADRLGLPLATFDARLAAKARARGLVVYGAKTA
jgi:predicted nucleic acid-binding protein